MMIITKYYFGHVVLIMVLFSCWMRANISVSIEPADGFITCGNEVTFVANVSCPGVDNPQLTYQWQFIGTGVSSLSPLTSTERRPTVSFEKDNNAATVKAVLIVSEGATNTFAGDSSVVNAGFDMTAILDNAQIVDDGDGDDNTQVFLLRWNLGESNPENGFLNLITSIGLDENSLPTGFSVSGGSGASILSREIDRFNESTIDVEWSCGSQKYKVKVLVYHSMLAIHADEGNRLSQPFASFGHAWWELFISPHTTSYIDPALRQFITLAGYYPMSYCNWGSMVSNNYPCAGELRLGLAAATTSPTGSRVEVSYSFNQIKSYLSTVRGIYLSPGNYNVLSHNCVHIAQLIIPLSWGFPPVITPWALSDLL
jgi:hypothetical protein